MPNSQQIVIVPYSDRRDIALFDLRMPDRPVVTYDQRMLNRERDEWLRPRTIDTTTQHALITYSRMGRNEQQQSGRKCTRSIVHSLTLDDFSSATNHTELTDSQRPLASVLRRTDMYFSVERCDRDSFVVLKSLSDHTMLKEIGAKQNVIIRLLAVNPVFANVATFSNDLVLRNLISDRNLT